METRKEGGFFVWYGLAGIGQIAEKRLIKLKTIPSTLYQRYGLDMVGVKGFEPPTSCSQSRRATNCATPRCTDIIPYPPRLVNRYPALREETTRNNPKQPETS